MAKKFKKYLSQNYKTITILATFIGLILLSVSLYFYTDYLRARHQEDISSGKFFYKMLEKNKSIKTYRVKASYKSDTHGFNSLKVEAAYTADVDISDLANIKINADYSVNDLNPRYNTVWIGSDIYAKITSRYKYSKCKNLFYLTSASNLPNCTHYTQSDVSNGLIMVTTPPYTDFPHFNKDSLPTEILENFEKTQRGQYQIYDGAEVDLDGKKTYKYNVITQNFKILDLNKTLLKQANQADKVYYLASSFGLTSPGRYLTVWIDKETNHLTKVESKVRNDVLTIEYFDINSSDIRITPPK